MIRGSVHVAEDMISTEELQSVRRQLRKEVLCDSAGTFFLTFCCGFGVTAMILDFMPHNDTSRIFINSLGGLTFALIVVVVMLWNGRKSIIDTSADVGEGRCEEWTIKTSRAVRVVPNGSWPAIAIDCGEHVIVLAGGWWTARNARSDIKWSGRHKDRFPSTEFVLRKLPRSGRVLAVIVSGEPLNVEYNESQTAPLLTVDHSGFVNCERYNISLDELIPEAR